MADYISDIKNRDNKISILQNLVEKNDGHVSRLKNMIEQLKKQLKFEQEKNVEMAKDMNKLRETIQTQNLKIRELQESLFKSKENERQLHIKIKDIQTSSPVKHTNGNSITNSAQLRTNNPEQNSQFSNAKSMNDISKFDDGEFALDQDEQLKLQKNASANNPLRKMSSPKQQALKELQNNKDSDDSNSLSSERKRRSPNLKVDSQSSKNQSYIDSPKLQRTMLSVVEEDLSNIVKSAQYQKELDPNLLKTIAKSIVAIKYTSKVMENNTYSIPCIQENTEECDNPIEKSNSPSPQRPREESGNLFRLKLNEVKRFNKFLLDSDYEQIDQSYQI